MQLETLATATYWVNRAMNLKFLFEHLQMNSKNSVVIKNALKQLTPLTQAD